MTLPLDGVRILAVEQYGAGPWATMYLADLGAEVMKIEDPVGGDFARASRPHLLGDHDSQFFQSFNPGKKSVALDIRKPAGAAAFRQVAATADAVLNNLRRDMPEKRGHPRRAGPGQPPHRLRAPVGLWPHWTARRLARIRLSDAGRGGVHGPDRRSRGAQDPDGPVERRLHDRDHPVPWP